MPTSNKTRVVVATTVLLSFISFWRAAAIVLNDLASSAYYVGGIAEQAIGKSAPWFILGVMLFSYAVRSVYVESCSMFTRGGVYRVVKEAMGGTMAKLSVSALMFDYILTGPISGVSAGQYLAGLISDTMQRFGRGTLTTGEMDLIAAALALGIVVYFWWQNIRGIRESSQRALRIMQITTAMVVLIIGWSLITAIMRGAQMPPFPAHNNIQYGPESLGWLRGTVLPMITPIAILIGLGHSILAMSGEETLAQVYREIEAPKIKNLLKAGLIIFIYSLIFTSFVSFFAVMLIPDAERPKHYDNLIGGLAMFVAGPDIIKLFLQAFVVIVGFLILAGAVNTSIVGSNGVLNRVSEDGVLSEWFRAPHRKFGTTYRCINMVVLLQLATILISRGRVYILGEAYAFGVVWSFAFKALGVLVLRYTQPGEREWRVPLNLRIGKIELPIGLGLITLILFSIAIINLFTKETATIAGICFSGAFYSLFTLSERRHRKIAGTDSKEMEQFQLVEADALKPESVGIRPGGVMVAVRDPNRLQVLDYALERTDTSLQDIVVVRIKAMGGGDAGSYYSEQVFTNEEQELFSKVVEVAEKHGKSVQMLTVPSTNPFYGSAQSAYNLQVSNIIAGSSSVMSPEEQSRRLGSAWDRIRGSSRRHLIFEVIEPSGQAHRYYLGVHAPKLRQEDLNLVHQLWVEVAGKNGDENVHHRDIVIAGLHLLEKELKGPNRAELIRMIKGEEPKQRSEKESERQPKKG